jgi:hypothetical protein
VRVENLGYALHESRKAAGDSENLGHVGPSANRFASSLESLGAFGAAKANVALRYRAFIWARESSVAVISSAPTSFLLAIALASFRSGTATRHLIAKHSLRPRLNFPSNIHPFLIDPLFCSPPAVWHNQIDHPPRGSWYRPIGASESWTTATRTTRGLSPRQRRRRRHR